MEGANGGTVHLGTQQWVQCDKCEKWRRVAAALAEGLADDEPWCGGGTISTPPRFLHRLAALGNGHLTPPPPPTRRRLQVLRAQPRRRTQQLRHPPRALRRRD
jgi:hypothetical protein